MRAMMRELNNIRPIVRVFSKKKKEANKNADYTRVSTRFATGSRA